MPGTKNGSQRARPIGHRQVTSPTMRTSVAVSAAKRNECQHAFVPAARVGRNSVHIFAVVKSSVSGTPTERTEIRSMITPDQRDNPAPSRQRKTEARACSSRFGQEI